MQDQKEADNRHTANAGGHWVYTPAMSIDAPATKTLLEDVTQAELVATLPSPVPENEEPAEESSTNNQLREFYVTDVQHNGNHIPPPMWSHVNTSQIISMSA